MLIRYRRSEDGKPVAKAVVYIQAEHRIEKSRLDPDALRIVERLRENGHEAYIVGGAVRDLLLGRRPKDFDIVTDAEPPRIKRIFRNARVIGRRFRLVHVYAGPNIFEVSTFRSIANGTVGNEYGTMDEDALRRDFTMNALYYDPVDAVLIDYVGGFKDIAARQVKPVIPLKTIFKEDPVRMIRCVKYASTSGCRIPLSLRLAIKRDSSLLADASTSRLTEEFVKILGSGNSAAIVKGLADFDLLRHLLPAAAERMGREAPFRRAMQAALAELDAYASDETREKRLALLLSHFLKPFLEANPAFLVDAPDAYQEAVREARLFLAPMNPPRVELEAAVLALFKKQGISPLQKPRRAGPERGGERRRAEARPEGRLEGRAPAGRNREDELHLREAEKKRASAEKAAKEELGEGGEAQARRRKRRRKSGAKAASAESSADAGAREAAAPADRPEGGQPSSSTSSAKRRKRRRRKSNGGSSGGPQGGERGPSGDGNPSGD